LSMFIITAWPGLQRGFFRENKERRNSQPFIG
jgi:hypothetical protein